MLSRLSSRWRSNAKSEIVNMISFPKTGSTWVRVLLGRYFQLLWSLDELVLLEATEVETALFARRGLPPIKVSHGPLLWSDQTADDLVVSNVVEPYANNPLVVITRHPLDALVSLKMQMAFRQRDERTPVCMEFADFVRDPTFGLNKFIKFHNLLLDVPNRHILRYEDIREKPELAMSRLLNFLNIPVKPAVLAQAIEFASFDNMRRMELSDTTPRYKSSGLPIFATGDRSNPNALHVREGLISGYRRYLTSAECEEFLNRVDDELSPAYGYLRLS